MQASLTKAFREKPGSWPFTKCGVTSDRGARFAPCRSFGTIGETHRAANGATVLPSFARGDRPNMLFAEGSMGINVERDIDANLQIGPTDQGMVRLFVTAETVEIPMDFDPDEAREIAEEILAAAKA